MKKNKILALKNIYITKEENYLYYQLIKNCHVVIQVFSKKIDKDPRCVVKTQI